MNEVNHQLFYRPQDMINGARYEQRQIQKQNSPFQFVA